MKDKKDDIKRITFITYAAKGGVLNIPLFDVVDKRVTSIAIKNNYVINKVTKAERPKKMLKCIT